MVLLSGLACMLYCFSEYKYAVHGIVEIGWGPMQHPLVGWVACERYRSQSVTVIRIVVSGVPLATH